MSTTSQDQLRYATAEDVILAATDKDPAQAEDYLTSQAKQRAASATRKWVTQTSRPFHPVRVGNPDDPRTWPVFDVADATTWRPVTIILTNQNPLPLDPDAGDTLEVREGRDSWRDVTSEAGETWTLDSRRKRLKIYQRRLAFSLFDEPGERFCRLTYRYGPLGEDATITDDGVVESVPADVQQAVAAKAGMRLALDDDADVSMPDDGQLSSRSGKREALKETWEETVADYTGFSTM